VTTHAATMDRDMECPSALQDLGRSGLPKHRELWRALVLGAGSAQAPNHTMPVPANDMTTTALALSTPRVPPVHRPACGGPRPGSSLRSPDSGVLDGTNGSPSQRPPEQAVVWKAPTAWTGRRLESRSCSLSQEMMTMRRRRGRSASGALQVRGHATATAAVGRRKASAPAPRALRPSCPGRRRSVQGTPLPSVAGIIDASDALTQSAPSVLEVGLGGRQAGVPPGCARPTCLGPRSRRRTAVAADDPDARSGGGPHKADQSRAAKAPGPVGSPVRGRVAPWHPESCVRLEEPDSSSQPSLSNP